MTPITRLSTDRDRHLSWLHLGQFLTALVLIGGLANPGAALSEPEEPTDGAEEQEVAQEEDSGSSEGGVSQLSGLTIVGAKETPKSLILVPWKDSNVDVTTDFGSLVDSVEIKPIHRETLKRKLLFDDLVKQDLKQEQAERASQVEQTEQAN